jgi:hypothetical protein
MMGTARFEQDTHSLWESAKRKLPYDECRSTSKGKENGKALESLNGQVYLGSGGRPMSNVFLMGAVASCRD